MSLFSQRKGLKPLEKTIQKDSVDQELRNALWTALHECIYEKWRDYDYGWDDNSAAINSLFNSYWIWYFKLPSDNQPQMREALMRVRAYFFECKWNEIYDFIEFTAKHSDRFCDNLRNACNMFLTAENSAYRFVGDDITQITNETEIEAIEKALTDAPRAVEIHLKASLTFLSDRKKPDFRNSIKEAISAVESLCKILSGDSKATLGPALKKVAATTPLHPAFERSLLSLYGFTSDEHGIRHALMDEPNLTYVDAKFMLVLCAGFSSYLLGKCAENGIKIQK